MSTLTASHSASDMSTSDPRHENSVDSRFSCNICLEAVQEPVVTQCGHLYCWPCLYRWLEPGMLPGERQSLGNTTTASFLTNNVDPTRRLCPVCKAHCSVPSLVPIYVRNEVLAEKQKVSTAAVNDTQNDDSTSQQQQQQLRQRHQASRVPARPAANSPVRHRAASTESIASINTLASSSQQHSNGWYLVPPLHRREGHGNASLNSLQEADPDATELLSRILLMLGSFVILCLLLF